MFLKKLQNVKKCDFLTRYMGPDTDKFAAIPCLGPTVVNLPDTVTPFPCPAPIIKNHDGKWKSISPQVLCIKQ